MPRNPYFKFQQFTVFHDKCAMKVGTDGTLLGAWADVSRAKNALDIGTGSGLIALMSAQKNKSLQIEAIDIDPDAVLQAEENIRRSPFHDRITVNKTSLQEYDKEKKFDTIISNPPFFHETLKSPNKQRAMARHADSLTPEHLFAFSSMHLNKEGSLSIIYPSEYKEKLSNLSKEHGLFPSRLTNIYPTPQSQIKRILIEFKTVPNILSEDDLIIEEERHVYSNKFKELVKDFYLREIAKNV